MLLVLLVLPVLVVLGVVVVVVLLLPLDGKATTPAERNYSPNDKSNGREDTKPDVSNEQRDVMTQTVMILAEKEEGGDKPHPEPHNLEQGGRRNNDLGPYSSNLESRENICR